MDCTKCGQDSVMIADLRYCGGCFKEFNECTCDPHQQP
jgi:hypothetical protein